jgi:hypothetical protein
MFERLRAVCDLSVPFAREMAGRHEYDGQVQDLSPDGVRAGLARLGQGPALDDPHDEAHLTAFEHLLRVELDELGEHRRNPLVHLSNLDLSVYDREYAPAEERGEARRRHLDAWPDGVDAALAALDRVPAPVAEALVPAVRGLAAGLDADADAAALAAHARFVAHLEEVAASGDPDVAIGGAQLARLLSAGEAMAVDLDALAADADAERDRLRALLHDACARLRPGAPPAQVVAAELADHPDADGVYDAARAATEEAFAFTRARDLVPYLDGECLVGPAPESRRWAMAMMSWAAPYEDDAPSWYHIVPPEPDWPEEEREEWLSVFSHTTLLAITVHEVAPGHFAHGRALRRAPTDVRRTLMSMAFAEGWAHYVEELCLEEGFRDVDARYQLGVALEALVRVTRLAVSIGVHTRALTVEDAAQRFREDAFLQGPAALSEARRATFDPTYGRYTWGKLAILALRDQARERWGDEYTHQRFHHALLDLGSPPLGLLATALERPTAATS